MLPDQTLSRTPQSYPGPHGCSNWKALVSWRHVDS